MWRITSACDGDDAAAFAAFAPAGVFFVMPADLPCDRTFVETLAEMRYVGAVMAGAADLRDIVVPMQLLSLAAVSGL